ncbi:uncharacterized protein LOC128679709 isoform X2 [Plodia interpunctella]|uniref:uncharacterized protein LOC128679709 isoform X2 n=1 Tax=Plodia interpunctella TaxID=58824 RepID=UPI0023682A84|nr:uncharacterized protein LOC128679709 isoform X2 [Plodia interpunctella]
MLLLNCVLLVVVLFRKCANTGLILSIKDLSKTLEGPKWPNEYYLKGEIEDIFNAGSEPFEIWYKENLNRSRVDVYDGSVKKFYWADREKLITFYPKTEDLETIEIACDYEPRNKLPYNILPADLNWTLTGSGTYNGLDTLVWEAKDKKYHYTTVTRKEDDFDVPIRLDKTKYEVGTGMSTDHSNIIFFDYNSTVEEATLDVESEKLEECGFYYSTIEEKLQHLKSYISHDVEVAFTRYKSHHKKTYNGNEHEMREEIFQNNWRRVQSQNNKNMGYKLELNKFADWTDEELASLRGALPSKVNDPGTHPFPHTLEELDRLVEELPGEYDLRLEGDLPPIKNQLACGSCWAFATTLTVEAAIIKKLGGVQLDLSEQSLVDCAWSYGALGCNGGFVDVAFKYVTDHGIPTETEYGRYLHEDGFCHINNMTVTHHIRGFTQVTPHSVNALKYAVYTYGSVEVSIHASADMTLYSSGVFYDMACLWLCLTAGRSPSLHYYAFNTFYAITN